MRITFTTDAWEDYLWFQQHDKALLKRINNLIKDVVRSPFEGLGKPEALRANLAGYWSRRIDEEHRFIDSATETEIVIVACRFHYQG
jgi:toxin-antitoxin system, toxin component, Txe/YoeB family